MVALGGGTRAASLGRRGRVAAAIKQADEVIRSGRAGHLELLPLIYGTDLERVAVAYAAAGRADEARATLAEALAMYERKGVVPYAKRVREGWPGSDVAEIAA